MIIINIGLYLTVQPAWMLHIRLWHFDRDALRPLTLWGLSQNLTDSDLSSISGAFGLEGLWMPDAWGLSWVTSDVSGNQTFCYSWPTTDGYYGMKLGEFCCRSHNADAMRNEIIESGRWTSDDRALKCEITRNYVCGKYRTITIHSTRSVAT